MSHPWHYPDQHQSEVWRKGIYGKEWQLSFEFTAQEQPTLQCGTHPGSQLLGNSCCFSISNPANSWSSLQSFFEKLIRVTKSLCLIFPCRTPLFSALPLPACEHLQGLSDKPHSCSASPLNFHLEKWRWEMVSLPALTLGTSSGRAAPHAWSHPGARD